MKYTLVGHTGFVGGNLAAAHPFDNLYNSANIRQGFGAQNGLVIYSGMPSEKFLANADPEADLARARQAMDNIRGLAPERLVLISTVDVYPRPYGVNENSPTGGENAPAYGKNRYALEQWVRQEYPEALVVRLPGLFGQGLKKNFIYDMFTRVPPMLSEEKYNELAAKQLLVGECYRADRPGFYRLAPGLAPDKAAALKAFFSANDFNSLCFTDSRSVFQFYNLAWLWRDINYCLKNGLRLVNLATEPVEAGALYHILFGEAFENHLDKEPARYDMRTLYGRDFGGNDTYIADRAEVVAEIAKFARSYFA